MLYKYSLIFIPEIAFIAIINIQNARTFTIKKTTATIYFICIYMDCIQIKITDEREMERVESKNEEKNEENNSFSSHN